jgi:hypothetical protein
LKNSVKRISFGWEYPRFLRSPQLSGGFPNQNPVPLETLEFQIRLAVTEASDLEFVPSGFRGAKPAHTNQANNRTNN